MHLAIIILFITRADMHIWNTHKETLTIKTIILFIILNGNIKLVGTLLEKHKSIIYFVNFILEVSLIAHRIIDYES